MRYTIHTKSGLRKFLVGALNSRKHVNVINEKMDGSIVVNCAIPLSNDVREFQIDIQIIGEDQ